ncbi:MAG: DNA gyrase inhibitor YacG [Pseudomonadota bacterium]
MTDPAGAPACPICSKPVELLQHRPFCSARCRQVDLGRWLSESYRVPGAPAQSNGAHDDDGDDGI